jgi:precorrin-3B methylase
VGLASRCGREGESSRITTLSELKPEEVDMQTIVFIGNSTTFVYQGFMVTPRGYIKKYGKKLLEDPKS